MALLDHDGSDRDRLARAWPRPVAIPVVDPAPRPVNDNRRDPLAAAPELACLTGLLPMRVLRAAATRARQSGTGADRVLIATGAIDEANYLHRFARQTGVMVETFANLAPGDAIALRDDQIAAAAQSGLLPLRRGDDLLFVVSPRHLAARQMLRAVASDAGLRARFRLATAQDFDAFLLHGRNRRLAHESAYGLRDRAPRLSAAPRMGRAAWGRVAAGITLAVLTIAALVLAYDATTQALALWFIAAIGLRFAAAVLPQATMPRGVRLPDRDLPVYSIIVALKDEARVVPQLLSALAALDYPPEKLDIILAVEPEDHATRAAIDRFGPRPQRRIIVAPSSGPRTKPKALNAALSFARGSFVAVFDAEDQPEPDQLRAALDVFRFGEPDIACAQARLCIDNGDVSLFTRMFAAEYAGQFDAVLPGLAAMRLPLPLGGTSNHFRTDVLRRVGGWDAWNVTEDADLGLRLARCGHRSVTFASTTYEEAPITYPRWLRQRSRWMKGWMQTLLVHLRDPRRLWRDAGWRGFVTLNFVLAGPIVSALAYPIFLVMLAYQAACGEDGLADGLLHPVHLTAIAGGLIATLAIGLIGLSRRGRLRDGWILLLTPLFWLCLSIATYWALFELLHNPYRWHKTEHGLGRGKKRRGQTAEFPRSRDAIAAQKLAARSVQTN